MLRVGIGKADITPPVGVPLSGFAVRQNRPSTAVDDALMVKALVIAFQSKGILLLSYDLLGLDTDLDRQIREMLQSAYGNQTVSEHILITTTHTHSGPTTMPISGESRVPEVYIHKLLAATLSAITQAVEGLAEARLYHASKDLVGINHNRRRGQYPQQPEEHFPFDPSFDLFVFKDPRGSCLAAFTRFACHAVTMTTQHISADYPGELARRLEAQLGAPCLFLQGAAGDLNPVVVSHDHAAMLGFVDTMMTQLADLPGRLKPVVVDSLRLEQATFPLPFAPFPTREAVLERMSRNTRILAGDTASPDLQPAVKEYTGWRYPDEPDIHGTVLHWAQVFNEAEQRTLEAIQAGEHLPQPLFRAASLRLGPFTFVFLSGEILTGVARQIQAAGEQVQVVGYLSPIVGYIANPVDYAIGGYEPDGAWMWYRMPGPFREDAAAMIVRHTHEIIQKLNREVHKDHEGNKTG